MCAAIQDFKDQGVLIQVPQGEKCMDVYSQIFLVPKPKGKYRAVIDLRYLNNFISKKKFKMETMQSTIQALREQEEMVTLDLQNAYLHIPIRPCHQKVLRVAIRGSTFTEHLQFSALPFGISSTPRVFTKVLVTAVAFLRTQGVSIKPYLDDCLIKADSQSILGEHVNLTVQVLQSLGWIINWEKSNLRPSTKIKFLGMILDTEIGKVSLPLEKACKIKDKVKLLQEREVSSIRQVTEVLGLFSAAIVAVPWAKAHMKELQEFLNMIWDYQKKSLNKKVHLPQEIRRSLTWWMQTKNLMKGNQLFPGPTKLITTDASKRGWGAHLQDISEQGRWYDRSFSQFIGVRGSLESLKIFCPIYKKRKFSGPYRQCNNSILLKSSRRSKKSRSYAQSKKNIQMGRTQFKQPHCSTHFRPFKFQSGLFKSQRFTSRRMESKPRGVLSDLQTMGVSRHRPHGIKTKQKSSKILLTNKQSSRSSCGCAGSTLEFQSCLHIPTINSISGQSSQENTTNPSGNNSNSSSMAKEELVLRINPTIHKPTMAFA
ncbi:uncharacterized protein adgrg1.L isoform X2 [Xenopus laevis]|uniref:ribonuclease H n=1 Tax=Xenopus laevis TaxID=8355 RepID=A0A8J1MWG0_XENLA|nr:uncharacterized protein adgrg1.L isoform X2 [Xenopus laevis]